MFSLGFQCLKSPRIRAYSGPYFHAFEMNTKRFEVSLRIQSECGKVRTRIIPNTGTFHAVFMHCTRGAGAARNREIMKSVRQLVSNRLNRSWL